MKSLYRKYRPKSLAEVVGQPQVTKNLRNALGAGKVSHAYLFVGPRGTGKTSVARIFAHEVNGFKYELEDEYVDIIEIDGASNRGIDNIRELREKVAIAPTMGKYKVYIIDEVHMLTKEAFNALLKTLEEPPEHAIFIMATTDAFKVPVTITSRAQTYVFKLAPADVMLGHLRRIADTEKLNITDGALEIIVRRGGGSFRDSLSLLDQISTLSEGEITEELVVRAMGLPEDDKIMALLASLGDLAVVSAGLKELLGSGVRAETIAEELIAKIVAEPRPELMGLLARLPEVRAPFAEAKLLVALSNTGVGQAGGVMQSNARAVPPTARVVRPSAGSVVRSGIGSTPRSAISSAPTKDLTGVSGDGSESVTAPDEAGTAKDAADGFVNADSTDFDWGKFLEKVQGLSEAVYSQVSKASYQLNGSKLEIYPEKKISQTILSRENNKKILMQASGLVVVIKSTDENPNLKNDALLSRISDIMGGEVKNDGGANPF